MNIVNGVASGATSGRYATRSSPSNGERLGSFPLSDAQDIARAVAAARSVQPAWASLTAVDRGNLIRRCAELLELHRAELIDLVRAETGKPVRDAEGEVTGAVEMAYFVAGEGRRLYGRTTTSGVTNKTVSSIRSPIGVAGLIVASNTPLPNYAWKAFPAILCGNAVVLKPSEDTPFSATRFVELLHEAGVPPGVVNLAHGIGPDTGMRLVEADIDVLSFTGSCAVGRTIAGATGSRLVKTCLELGGKNPLLVCDDADLDGAAEAAALSAFSNAGQRCAAASRIIVMDGIYDDFSRRLLDRTNRLRVGREPDADIGPLISERQLGGALETVKRTREEGGRLLAGGSRITDHGLSSGLFLAPTLLDEVDRRADISHTELFAPVAVIYRASDFSEALELADDNAFGLTAAIWTSSIDRAAVFTASTQAGMVVVNGPTYGSEPHMPFGGFRQSGNGFREAGTEVLDVYSDWKTIAVIHDPVRAR